MLFEIKVMLYIVVFVFPVWKSTVLQLLHVVNCFSPALYDIAVNLLVSV